MSSLPFLLFLCSKQLQMWLQKDDYDNAHNDRSLGIVCPFPVHSLKQRKLLDSAASSNANYTSRNAGKPAVYMPDICVTGSTVNSTTIKCAKLADNVNRNNDNAGGSLVDSNNCRSVICVNPTEKESESGSVRSILNILDSFKLEDMNEDKTSTSVATGNNKTGISVVESSLLLDAPSVDPNANAKPEPLKEKKSVFNEECLINGMSQGDRLQQIKSMRRHARATTTGALK